MKRNYRLIYSLIVYMLFVGLFLQSCSNLSNPFTLNITKSTEDTLASTKRAIIKQLVDKQFTAKGGYLVNFHEQNGKLEAEVEMSTPEGFCKTYTNLPIRIASDIELQKLSPLTKEEQERIIHFNSPQNGQQASLFIYKEGLLGGMMEGDEDPRGKEEEPINGADTEEKERRYKTVLFEESDEGNLDEKDQEKEELKKRHTLYSSTIIRKGLDLDPSFQTALLDQLPAGYELGEAYGEGDCFFDALAQWANKVTHTDVNTDKYLRLLCHEFYQENKNLVAGWDLKDRGEKAASEDRYVQHEYYYSKIQYTAGECDSLLNKDICIWGRPWVEGVILCRKLQLKGICFIEVFEDPETGNPVISYHLVNQVGYESSISEEAGQALVEENNIPVLVNVQGKLHFVPLWEKNEVLKNQNKFKKSEETQLEKGHDTFLQEEGEIQRKPKNALPNINYDNSALMDVLKETSMEPVKEEAILYLQNIQEEVDTIKRYQSKEHPEHFYGSMQESILEIRNTARCLYELTESYHNTLPNTVRRLILDSIALFERELDKRLEMSIEEEEALKNKTKLLYAQQSYISRQPDLQNKLMEHLGKLKKLLTKMGKPTPYCYISYAWPCKENQKEEYWVQPFLFILYDHLTAAGIRMNMDIRDNKPGDSIYKFIGEYRDGNYIILAGTESLLEEHHSITTHVVKTELSIINNRFEKDQRKYGYSRIYPLLISGTINTSFPEIYEYIKVRDAREIGYVLMIRHLIDWLFKQQIIIVKTEYENLWGDFDKNCKCLPKEASSQTIKEELRKKYHRQRLDYLKQDQLFQDVQARHTKPSAVPQPQTFFVRHKDKIIASGIGAIATGFFIKWWLSEEGKNVYPFDKAQKSQKEENCINTSPKFHSYIEESKLDYIPREDKEEELRKKLETTGICVVHGAGGMGKSTLATKYGHDQKDKQAVWYMRANQLREGYETMAQELKIYYKELAQQFKTDTNKYLKELSRKVYNALEDCKQPILLILDNANNKEELALIEACLLHKTPLVQVVITTRDPINSNKYSQVELSTFTEKEGKIYIQQRLGVCPIQPNEKEIEALIKEVSLIPQKLALATGTLREKRLMTIEEYIDKLQKLKKDSKKEEEGVILPEVSLGLETLDISSQLMMRYSVYLDPGFIPLPLIAKLIKMSNKEVLEKLLDKLERLSLISIKSNYDSELGIKIHQDVQTACKEYQDWKGDKKWWWPIESNLSEQDLIESLVQTLDKVMPNLSELPDDMWDKAKLYAPQVAHFLVTTGIKELPAQPLLADLFNRMGDYSQKIQIDYQKALEYYKRAFEINLYTDNHGDIAISLNNLGNVYQLLGEYNATLNCHQKALKMWQDVCTGNHPNIAISLNNLGGIYQLLGKYEEALNYYQQGLKMNQQIYIKKNHAAIAISLTNIGTVYKDLWNNQAALDCHQKALKMWQAIYTDIEIHPHIATSLNNIGVVYTDLGKFNESLKYSEKSLEMWQAIYIDTGNHPDIARLLGNLGGNYLRLRQYQEALKYRQQALKMWKAIYIDTSNHPNIAKSLNDLGEVYHSSGEDLDALKHHREALEMLQNIYTGNHPDIAISFNCIGDAYQALGKYKKALKYHQKALKMWENIYTGIHPAIGTSLRGISEAHYSLGEYQKAFPYSQRALEMWQALVSGNRPNTTSISFTELGSSDASQGIIGNQVGIRDKIETIVSLEREMNGNICDDVVVYANTDTDGDTNVDDFENNGEEICIAKQSVPNSANRYASILSTAVRWIKNLASWSKEEQEGAIDPNNIHIKGLLKLKTKCKKMIEGNIQVKTDRWYQYSLEDMVEDIDEVLREVTDIDEATLAHFKKRLSGIHKDFLRSEMVRGTVVIPYKSEPSSKQLEQVQLLAPTLPGLNMIDYQGCNMLALLK